MALLFVPSLAPSNMMLSVTVVAAPLPSTLVWYSNRVAGVMGGPPFCGLVPGHLSIVVGSRFGSSSVASAALTVGADGADGASVSSSVTLIVTDGVAASVPVGRP